jgi:hypothetical protein
MNRYKAFIPNEIAIDFKENFQQKILDFSVDTIKFLMKIRK